jgi:hypothetical protein
MARTPNPQALPFKSFRNVVSFDWPAVDGMVRMHLYPRSYTTVRVSVPLADIELRYPLFQQAMRYMVGLDLPAPHYLGHLKRWETTVLRRNSPVILHAAFGTYDESVCCIATMRLDHPSGMVKATTAYGTKWEYPLGDIELQFPGFSHYIALCGTLDLGPKITTQMLVEWLENFVGPDTSPSFTLPSDLAVS